MGVIMSSSPQNRESAISMLVPAVFLVFRKMNLCSWDIIIAYLTTPWLRWPRCPEQIKALPKKAAARTREALVEAMGQALEAVTSEDAEGWFAHCGY